MLIVPGCDELGNTGFPRYVAGRIFADATVVDHGFSG